MTAPVASPPATAATGTATSAPSAPGGAEDHAGHRGDGRPLVDAEDVGAGQAVARDALRDRPREPERRADGEADEAAGQPPVDDHCALELRAPAREDTHDLDGAHGKLPDAEAEHPHQRAGGEQHRNGAHRARLVADPCGTEDEKSSLAGLGCASHARRARHACHDSLTASRWRTSHTKAGAPTSAMTMPACSSPGRMTTRPKTSAESSRQAPASPAYGVTQR